MNENQKDKLRKFANDKVMSDAVFNILLNSFIKPKPSALVNEQAASFIAIGLIQDAWKEIEKFKNIEEEKTGIKSQVGL